MIINKRHKLFTQLKPYFVVDNVLVPPTDKFIVSIDTITGESTYVFKQNNRVLINPVTREILREKSILDVDLYIENEKVLSTRSNIGVTFINEYIIGVSPCVCGALSLGYKTNIGHALYCSYDI